MRFALPIVTDRLVLRPFTIDDAGAVHDYQRLPEVAEHLLWPPRDLEQTTTAIAQMATETRLDDDGDCLCLAVVRDDVVIGQVELVRRGAGKGELGYIFHPGHHGRGFATEAARALRDLGFDLGMTEIIGRCSARNEASVHLMRRLGMRQTGTDRAFIKGAWRDALTFSITRTETGMRTPPPR